MLRSGLLRLKVYGSLALVAAALAAGGCGGGSSDAKSAGSLASGNPTPSGSSRVPSQLVARADAICRRLNTEIVATNPSKLQIRKIVSLTPQRVALERTALKELSKLAPPASIARDWRQMMAYRKTLIEELIRLGRYAKANDTQSIKSLAVSKKRVHQRLFATATRDGFKDCARVG